MRIDCSPTLIIILTIIIAYYPTYTGPVIYLKTDLDGYINIDNYPEKIDHNILKTDREHLFWSSYTSRGIPVFNTAITDDDIAKVHNKYDKYYIGKAWFGGYAAANINYYFTRMTQLNLTLDNVVQIGLTNRELLGYKEFIYNYAATVGKYSKDNRCLILNKMTHYYYPCDTFDWFVGQFLKKFAGVFRECEINLTGDPVNRNNIIKNTNKLAKYDIKVKDSMMAIYQAIINGWECAETNINIAAVTVTDTKINADTKINIGIDIDNFNITEFTKMFKADKRRTKQNTIASHKCISNMFGKKEATFYLFDLFDLIDN